jgi:heptosyltransferase-2
MGHSKPAAGSGRPRSSILHPQRILIRGLNWLGNAVMSTPALARLREHFPEAQIALLTPEKLGELWTGHPAINETISFASGEGVFSVGRKLRSARFDVGLVLPNSPRSGLEVFLARIPWRIGYARPWRNWLLTNPVPPRSGRVEMHKRSDAEVRHLITHHASRTTFPASSHHIHDYLHLAAFLGANAQPLPPQLHVSTSEIAQAAHKFGLHFAGQREHPCFGLNAGAEYGPAKRWPRERFVSAAAELQRRTHCQWIVFGGPNETDLAARIANEIESVQKEFTHHARQFPAPVNVASRTSLRELMALLKLCRAVLTNDTGPMHVAAALGTPVVVPFGSTSPELTGPGLPGYASHLLLTADVPCAPCFRRTCPIDFRCMTGISVERTVAAMLQAAHVGSYS